MRHSPEICQERSQKHYKSIVDEWYVWDSLEDVFRRAEAWND
jgi:hypothetical protein